MYTLKYLNRKAKIGYCHLNQRGNLISVL